MFSWLALEVVPFCTLSGVEMKKQRAAPPAWNVPASKQDHVTNIIHSRQLYSLQLFCLPGSTKSGNDQQPHVHGRICVRSAVRVYGQAKVPPLNGW